MHEQDKKPVEPRMVSQANRASDLARIHILQKQLGMSQDDASAFKLALTGMASAAGMSFEQRARCIAQMERLLPATDAQKTRPKRLAGPLALMYSLWQQAADGQVVRDRRFAALVAFAKGRTGVDQLHWLSKPQQDLVIKALREMAHRGATA